MSESVSRFSYVLLSVKGKHNLRMIY